MPFAEKSLDKIVELKVSVDVCVIQVCCFGLPLVQSVSPDSVLPPLVQFACVPLYHTQVGQGPGD